MNLLNTLRGLGRRWYIVVPGIILAVVVAVGTWLVVKPAYERTASEQLLPGVATLPEGATNPYLYLGGLAPAADLLVRAVGSQEALRDIDDQFPGTQAEVSRDPSASGPVILITVTATSDETAGVVLNELVERTGATLEQLQTEEGVPEASRITIRPISIDQESTLQQRNRLVATVGAGAGIVLLTIVLASVVDGLATRSRRSKWTPDADAETAPLDPDAAEVVDSEFSEDAATSTKSQPRGRRQYTASRER